MQKNRRYFADKIRIHCNNLNLKKATPCAGLVGPSQSELVARLTAKIQTQKENSSLKYKSSTSVYQDSSISKQRIQDLLREETNLKRQMLRIADLSKNYKNAKIAVELKYESLMKDYEKQRIQLQQSNQKLKATIELNSYLMKITENTLAVLPHYQNNCHQLQHHINSTKQKLDNRVSKDLKDEEIISVMDDLYKRLDSFKNEVDNMQSYQNKMMSSLVEAHHGTKSANEKLSVVSSINMDELTKFREQIGNIPNTFQSYDPSHSFVQPNRKNYLIVESQTHTFTYFPDSAARINKVFTDISLLFEQHIHLLQTQKMDYQFTKNKKLLACQQFQCTICESYEKIVSQTFTIVRQAFKQIKFHFLKEIKQIHDLDQIQILI